MGEDSAQERTEQATPKRLREARERGQIARSRELNTMAVLLSASGSNLWLAPSVVKGLLEMLRAGLERHQAQTLDVEALPAALADGVSTALLILAPFLVLMLLASLLVLLAVGGWNLSPQALTFRWERLDSLKGLKRIFSSHGLVELLKAFGKFALIAATATVLL
jgi:flagellar biosynthetic protein FlhB